MKYKRIAIIGISGSGKSTFSRYLADKLSLSLFHMDVLFWKGNWQAIPESEYLKEHELLIQKDQWIIEGYIDQKMKNRLAAADLILYLDYSGIRCVCRLISRWLKHRKKARLELPKEALEKFDSKFFWLVLTRGERKNIEKAIQSNGSVNLKRFSKPKELNKFVKTELV